MLGDLGASKALQGAGGRLDGVLNLTPAPMHGAVNRQVLAAGVACYSEKPIALAAEEDKALVIHTRDADDATLDMLAARASGVRVIMHCFSMPDRLDEVLDHGWFV